MSDIILSNIQLWRQKAAEGSLTTQEYKDIIAAVRKERTTASTVSAKSRAKKADTKEKAKPIDSNSLLLDFMNTPSADDAAAAE